jgi:ligand-binding SRPBCC domain-containing protein
MAKVYTFSRRQYIDATPAKVWEFVSSPANLSRITPPGMGFNIVSPLESVMYEGMIIVYRVRPLAGIPVTWVTEITHITEGRYFVDEQRSGPYAMWHHRHFLEPEGDGTLMTDIVTYRPPFGLLGKIVNTLFIRKRLKQIFGFREKAMNSWAARS